jgi:hypothetical protein
LAPSKQTAQRRQQVFLINRLPGVVGVVDRFSPHRAAVVVFL